MTDLGWGFCGVDRDNVGVPLAPDAAHQPEQASAEACQILVLLRNGLLRSEAQAAVPQQDNHGGAPHRHVCRHAHSATLPQEAS